ncbi:MAG: hypothetical protein RL318_11 [Fibrobacterota bacterium]
MKVPFLAKNRKLFFGLGGGLAVAAIGISVWMFRGKPPAPSAIPAAVSDTSKVDDAMEAWVWSALKTSGFPTEHKAAKLVRSGKSWVADFRGLPLWTLPEEDHSGQIGYTFPDSIRIDSASLCTDLPPTVKTWLDRMVPNWKTTQRCKAGDQEARLNEWLTETSGKIVLRKIGKDAQGQITTLHLSCKDSKVEFPVGRILHLRALHALQLDNCALAMREKDGTTWSSVQSLLQHSPVVTLRLTNVHARLLNLAAMERLDTLSVTGGDLSWLEIPDRCPIGKDDCPQEEHLFPRSMSFTGIPLCDVALDSNLNAKGAALQGMKCDEYPKDVATQADAIAAQFFEEVGKNGYFQVNDNAKPLRKKHLKFTTGNAKWSGVRPGEFSCMRGDSYLSEVVRLGEDWISYGRRGTIFTGSSQSLADDLPNFGAVFTEFEPLLPQALVRTDHFAVWADEDVLQLIMHMDDSGKLDALWFPSGCWTQSWVSEARTSHPNNEGD